MTRIAIIVGSTRPGRNSRAVADWFHQIATAYITSHELAAQFDVLDLADFDLSHLNEEIPAAMGAPYTHDRTQNWSQAISSFDGYVIVTPEYNHSIPGVLKDAFDYLYREWHNKSIGFVSYGLAGGVRATEHLRTIAAELKLADVRATVALSIFTDFETMSNLKPADHHRAMAHELIDQVLSWSRALSHLRAEEAPAT
jgi:NAD(P)H-dependent FMN reductase